MNTRAVYENCEFYKRRLMEKRLQLERSKVINEEVKKLRIRVDAIDEMLFDVVGQLNSLKKLETIITKESDSFRERRVTYLDDQITDALSVIFPEKDFKAKIQYDFKYGSSKAYLRLKDRKGNNRSPFVTEGKLCQYTIGFISTVSTVVGLGASIIFIDEAFGVSSKKNLPKIGEMIQSYADTGLQFIIISQSSDLYADIPRREIHLELEKGISQDYDKVALTKVIDF